MFPLTALAITIAVVLVLGPSVSSERGQRKILVNYASARSATRSTADRRRTCPSSSTVGGDTAIFASSIILFRDLAGWFTSGVAGGNTWELLSRGQIGTASA